MLASNFFASSSNLQQQIQLRPIKNELKMSKSVVIGQLVER